MEEFEPTGYTVNLNQVIKDNSILAITRLLAHNLLSNPYFTLKDFLTSITDDDLAILNQKSENTELEDIMLITLMLIQGEGLEFNENDEKLRNNIGQMIMFLTIETLARKGLVKAYRENMSFGDDVGDRIIVEKL